MISAPFHPIRKLLQGSAWRVVVVGAGAMAVLLVAWLVVLRLIIPAGRMSAESLDEQAMPDGTILVLEQMRTGDSHPLELRAPPSTFFEWLTGSNPVVGRPVVRVPVKDALTLFFSRRDPSSGKHLDFDWLSHCTVAGDDGQEHRDLGYRGGVTVGDERSGKGDRYAALSHATIRPVRHAGPSFKLRVYDNQQRVVAEFDVPHPGGTAQPVWEPDPLPATRTNDSVSVTLKEVRHELVEYVFTNGLTLEQLQIVPELQIDEVIAETVERWKCRLSGVDALGNRIDRADYWFEGQHELAAIDWSPLNLDESAWRLQVTLLAGRSQAFEPGQETTISGVEVPSRGSVAPVGHSTAVNGGLVELLSIGGEGVVRHELKKTPSGSHVDEAHGSVAGGDYVITCEHDHAGRVVKVSSPCPHVIVRADDLPEGHEFLLRAVDDQGRSVVVEHDRVIGLDFWLLQTQPDVKRLDLAMIVYQPRQFEFLISPPRRADSQKVRVMVPRP